MRRIALLAAATVAVAAGSPTSPLAAQSTGSAAANVITAAEISRHVSVIAHDSMLGRATPSPGLKATAQYVANELAKAGARPRGDMEPNGQTVDTSWFQQYPVLGRLKPLYEGLQLTLTTKLRHSAATVTNEEGWPMTKSTTVSFGPGGDARLGVDTVPESGGQGIWGGIAPPRPFVVAGPHTLESVRRAKLRDKLVLYVPPLGIDTATERHIVSQLYASNHVVVLSDEDSTTFAERKRAAEARKVVVVNRHMEDALGVQHWVAYVRANAVGRFLATAGLDLDRMRNADTAVVQELPSMQTSLSVTVQSDTTRAPNVVGVIPGTDTAYSRDVVVFVAHMDGHGTRQGTADSINNGAVDNASGVAGLIALAKAFGQPGARPKRSVLFVAVSGSVNDFEGAHYFVNNPQLAWDGDNTAAVINLDMIGRRSGDSVTVDGMSDLELAARPDWIAAQHPELGITVVDGGTIATDESDHAAFVRKALPSLYFHNGSHDDAPRGREAPTTVDAEHEAKVLRLAYYVGQGIGNAPRRPAWSATGRRHRLEMLGQ